LNCIPPSSNFDQDDNPDYGGNEPLPSIGNALIFDEDLSRQKYMSSGSTHPMNPTQGLVTLDSSSKIGQAGLMSYPPNNFESYQYNSLGSNTIVPTQNQYPTSQQQYQRGPASAPNLRNEAEESWTSEHVDRDLSDALNDLKIDPVGVGMFNDFLG